MASRPRASNTTAAPPATRGSSQSGPTTGLSGRAGPVVGPAVGPARPPLASDSLIIVLICLCIVLGTTFMT
ncbi:hypothetical protein CRUP_025001 [Coryphaenoides rupestris]|nr:hypothetical protein CRUP_025001 [Coryphaenoides rupestris]